MPEYLHPVWNAFIAFLSAYFLIVAYASPLENQNNFQIVSESIMRLFFFSSENTALSILHCP